MSEFNPEDSSIWNYTQNAGDILRINSLVKGNRHLIGRDTDVLNGVYTGAYGGEAIVVDYDRETEYYDMIVDRALDRALTPEGTVDKGRVLDSVFDVASELMPYSQEGVDAVNKKHDIKDLEKVSLAVYIEEKVGVCRHQALLVKAMLEILKNRGVVSGNASIDRNIQWPEAGDPEGHAWVRYTNSAGEVFILDVAQKFIGTLEESQTQTRGWNYLRPDEIAARKPKTPLDMGKTSFSGIIDGIPDHLK